MANKKISQLTEVTNPNATDVIPVVNASETKKAQLGNLPISDATQSALDGKQDTLGYTAENVANRSTDVDADKTSLTKYPVVKAVYDWAVSLFATISQLNTKQDTLVSGTNIKTINSESLLGSGNIAIDLSPISVDGDKVSIAADTTATTQTTAVIQATDTNSGIAIVPNGTGAFTLDVPDGTATGGNARGNNAVDLQISRTSATQVAKGNLTVIGGGGNNQIGSEPFATISGGASNTIGNNTYATIGGGQSNTVSANYGTISGGGSNTVSTNTLATVVGGYQNSSTGQYSISGGYSNVASGLGSVSLGYNNTSSGSYAVSLGLNNIVSGINCFCIGSNNTVSGNNNIVNGILNTDILGQLSIINGRENKTTSGHSYGIVSGYKGKGYLHNQMVHSNEGFDIGECQVSSVVARNNTTTFTTGQTTSLFIDYLGKKIIPDGNNRVWNVTIKYTAVVTSITGTATGVSVGDCKNEVLTIGFKKIGGTSSVVGSLNTLSTNEDLSMSTASFGVTAGASQEMKLDFTAPTFLGGGSVTTRVVAKVELTEVAY